MEETDTAELSVETAAGACWTGCTGCRAGVYTWGQGSGKEAREQNDFGCDGEHWNQGSLSKRGQGVLAIIADGSRWSVMDKKSNVSGCNESSNQGRLETRDWSVWMTDLQYSWLGLFSHWSLHYENHVLHILPLCGCVVLSCRVAVAGGKRTQCRNKGVNSRRPLYWTVANNWGQENRTKNWNIETKK